MLSDRDTRELAEGFRGLSNARSLRIIIVLLRAGDPDSMTVNDVTAAVGLRQPTVSRYLRRLVRFGVLTRSREGTRVYHSVADETLERLRALFTPPFGESDDRYI